MCVCVCEGGGGTSVAEDVKTWKCDNKTSQMRYFIYLFGLYDLYFTVKRERNGCAFKDNNSDRERFTSLLFGRLLLQESFSPSGNKFFP